MLRLPESAPAADSRIIVRFQADGAVPDIVREICEDRGWTEFDPSQHGPAEWNLWWKTGRFRPGDFERLESWQRLNHHRLQGAASITSKDGLLREMRVMQGAHGKSLIDFVPDTFVMPREERQFQRQFVENREKNAANFWIFKPADLSRGRGIFVFNELSALRYSEKSVVQKYIADPYLIGGYKFDLRLYAVAVSFRPLVIYIAKEGIVRFSTERYDLKNLCNVYSHLTNTSINVRAPSYDAKKLSVGKGCKWSLTSLRNYLCGQGVDDHATFAQIQAIVVLTIMAQARSVGRSHGNCYELYGFDVLLDSKMKPWLLEVNFSPAMSVDCPADADVKRELLTSVFDLLNFSDADLQRVRQPSRLRDKRHSVDSGVGSATSARRQRSAVSLSRGATFSDTFSRGASFSDMFSRGSTHSEAFPGRESSCRTDLPAAQSLPPLLASLKVAAKQQQQQQSQQQHRHQQLQQQQPTQEQRQDRRFSTQVRGNRAALLRSRHNSHNSCRLRHAVAARKQRPVNHLEAARPPLSGSRQRLRMLPPRDPHAIDNSDREDVPAIDTGEEARQAQQQQQQQASPYGSCPITQRWRSPAGQCGCLRLVFPFNDPTEAACRDIRQHERAAVREVQRLLRAQTAGADCIWQPAR